MSAASARPAPTQVMVPAAATQPADTPGAHYEEPGPPHGPVLGCAEAGLGAGYTAEKRPGIAANASGPAGAGAAGTRRRDAEGGPGPQLREHTGNLVEHMI
jgi:hypothetical protein